MDHAAPDARRGCFCVAGSVVGDGLIFLQRRTGASGGLQLGAVQGGVAAVAGLAAGRDVRLRDRPLVRAPADPQPRIRGRLAFFGTRLGSAASFPRVLLLQLALPSEVPGYLCGLPHVRFSIYAAALAIAEVRFAAGTVLLGDSPLRQQAGLMLLLAVACAVLIVVAWRALHRQLEHPPVTGARPD